MRLWSEDQKAYVTVPRLELPEDAWRQKLTKEQYHVVRAAGTERAFTGAYWNNHEHGIYRCVACGTDLFRSEAKYESGTGWPSFFQPIAPENVATKVDRGFFMVRTEVVCPRCGAHLGHVFDDGPVADGGLRYCMNSAALRFIPADRLEDEGYGRYRPLFAGPDADETDTTARTSEEQS